MNYRFTWGDEVRVSASAPAELRPGAYGAVVGLDDRFAEPHYTVEYGDGTDALIAESLLEPDLVDLTLG